MSNVYDLLRTQDKDIDELDTCDIEDSEELYLAVDENNEYDSDDLCNLSADDCVEPVDNADDVINELQCLLEVQSFLLSSVPDIMEIHL